MKLVKEKKAPKGTRSRKKASHRGKKTNGHVAVDPHLDLAADIELCRRIGDTLDKEAFKQALQGNTSQKYWEMKED